MTALAVAKLAVDVLVATASATAIVLAAVVFVRSRRTGSAGLFGRVVHRPWLWAWATMCLGVAGLMQTAREIMPGSWQKPRSLIYGVLMLAFLVLTSIHLISARRAERRRDC